MDFEKKSNIKKGTGKYYRGYKNKSGSTVPRRLVPRDQIGKFLDELFDNKEEISIVVDLEEQKAWIQRL